MRKPKIILEFNKRFGHGYQARFVMDSLESVLDDNDTILSIFNNVIDIKRK